MNRKLVREKKKKNRELLSDYRRKLEKELQDYCEELGGHNFMPWKDDSWLSVGGHYNERYVQTCWDCEKRIYKKREDIDKVLWISETDLKECGDIEGLPYRSRNSYKVPLINSEAFIKGSLVLIKTDRREVVGRVESVFDSHLIVAIINRSIL
jgi:hypothetical protein